MRYWIACVFGLVSFSFSSCDIGTKKEGAELQSAEFKFRGTKEQGTRVEKIGDRAFLCALTEDGIAVVMLDPKYDPYYRQLPERAAFMISDEEFSAIRKSKMASRTVLNVLESRIQKQPDRIPSSNK